MNMKETVKCLLAATFIGIVAPFITLGYELVVYNTYEFMSRFFPLAPILGATVVIVIDYIFKPGRGTTEGIIRALYQGEDIPAGLAPVIFIGSLFTIGFGLSAGTAAPLVFFGAALGMVTARICKVHAIRRNALILVGSAATLAAHISAPLTATLFVFEVIAYGVIVERDAILVAIASASSVAIADLIADMFGLNRAYGYIPSGIPPTSRHSLAVVIVAGVLCGIFSSFIVYLFEALYLVYKRINRPFMLYLSAFATLLVRFSSPIVLSPKIPVLSGEEALEYALLKPLLTALTLTFGGIGGTFIPTISAAIAFGEFLNELFSVDYLAPIALAAVFGAASRCPIASILLALEMFSLSPTMTPRLVLATTLATLTHLTIAKELSLYTISIVASHIKVRSFYFDPRRCIRVSEIYKPIEPIRRDEQIAKALYIMHEKRVHALPIVDDQGRLIGIVTLGDFKRAYILGTGISPQDPIWKISTKRKPITITPRARAIEALDLMDKYGIDHLVVVDGPRVLGILSRDDVLRAIRKNLAEERTLGTRRRLRHSRRPSLPCL